MDQIASKLAATKAGPYFRAAGRETGQQQGPATNSGANATTGGYQTDNT
tara:strand:- start:6091 stop:6237 length:147 start_codon:yes stop_codon:yes gene_type:complete